MARYVISAVNWLTWKITTHLELSGAFGTRRETRRLADGRLYLMQAAELVVEDAAAPTQVFWPSFRRGNNLKSLKGFQLKGTARIWH